MTNASAGSPDRVPRGPVLPRATSEFLDLLEKYMKPLRWNQAELARRAGIDKAILSHWKKGDRGVSRAEINRIAVAIAIAHSGEQHQRTQTGGKRGRGRPSIKSGELKGGYLPSVQNIDALLFDMYQAAGHLMRTESGNQVWTSLLTRSVVR